MLHAPTAHQSPPLPPPLPPRPPPSHTQAVPSNKLSEADIDALSKRTQDGGTEVVTAKAGKGSATLSMAYAGALFAGGWASGQGWVRGSVREASGG